MYRLLLGPHPPSRYSTTQPLEPHLIESPRARSRSPILYFTVDYDTRSTLFRTLGTGCEQQEACFTHIQQYPVSTVVAGNKLCSPKNISFFVAKVQLLSESLHKFDYNWLIFLCKVFEIWRNYFGSESYFIRNFDLSVFFFYEYFLGNDEICFRNLLGFYPGVYIWSS